MMMMKIMMNSTLCLNSSLVRGWWLKKRRYGHHQFTPCNKSVRKINQLGVSHGPIKTGEKNLA